jgi:hypothetical protein
MGQPRRLPPAPLKSPTDPGSSPVRLLSLRRYTSFAAKGRTVCALTAVAQDGGLPRCYRTPHPRVPDPPRGGSSTRLVKRRGPRRILLAEAHGGCALLSTAAIH